MTRRILPTFLSSFCSSLPLQIGFPLSRWAAGECCKVGNFLSLIFFSLRFISLSSHWLLIKINFNRIKLFAFVRMCARVLTVYRCEAIKSIERCFPFILTLFGLRLDILSFYCVSPGTRAIVKKITFIALLMLFKTFSAVFNEKWSKVVICIGGRSGAVGNWGNISCVSFFSLSSNPAQW